METTSQSQSNLCPHQRLVTWFLSLPLASLKPRILFSFRLSASVCLALFITYWLELQNSFWAATTAAIVCQPNLGASLQKGRYRVLGTIIGAIAIVTCLAFFAQQRNTVILLLSLWCGLCGCAVVMLRNYASYAAGLSGITATIIFADAISDPTTAFFLALTRVGEICIGIGAAALVALLTENAAAARQLSNTLESTTNQLIRGFGDSLDPAHANADQTVIRHDIVRSLGLLRNQVDAAVGESSYLHSRRGNMRLTLEHLLAALVGWRNIDHLGSADEDQIHEAKAKAHRMVTDLDGVRSKSDHTTFARTCRTALAELECSEHECPGAQIVTDGLIEIIRFLEATGDCQALLGVEGSPAREGRFWLPLAMDPLPILLAGLRVFAAVLLTSIFWVETAWSIGQFCIVFAAIATLVFASFGDEARALSLDYSTGASLMVAVGGVIYFAILPALNSYPELLSVLMIFLAVVGFMQAGKWHSVIFLAMSVCCLPILGIGNPPVYNATNYFNLSSAILVGSVFGTVMFAVFPTISPLVRERRLIARSQSDLRAMLRDTTPISPLRWIRAHAASLCALPPGSSDAQFTELVAISAASRSISRLRRQMASYSELSTLQCTFEDLAEGKLLKAEQGIKQMDELAASPAISAPRTTSIHVRAELRVLLDIIKAHGSLFRPDFAVSQNHP